MPINPLKQNEITGVAGFDFEGREHAETFAAKVLFHLWPVNTQTQHQNMNFWIHKFNQNSGKQPIREATEREFHHQIGIMYAANGYNQKGVDLWKPTKFPCFFECPEFGKRFGMSFNRYEEQKKFFVYAFCDPNVDTDADPWWRVRGIVDAYNENRERNIAPGFVKVLDESMSAWCPQTTKTGGLPAISFVLRKPEPLGTELKVKADAETKINLKLEIQEGKEAMQAKGPHHLGATAACTHRLAAGKYGPDDSQRSLLIADSWFGTYQCALNLFLFYGIEAVLCIKTGHRCTPKSQLEEVMKHWPAGSYAVLTHTATGVGVDGEEADVDLVFVGYKYNCKKTLFFLMTKDAGSTKPDPLQPYIAKFPDQNGNLRARAVPRCACLSNYFINSNCIDSHNHRHQHELAMEKKWILRTDDAGWFRITTTVLGMTLVDAQVSTTTGKQSAYSLIS